MVLALIRVARLCLIIGAILTVLAFTLSGAVMAHDPAQPGQWIAGAFAGYLVGVVVAGVTFGALAALFDIQQQIRVLVDLTRAQQAQATKVLVALILLYPFVARADDIPRFDVETACHRLSAGEFNQPGVVPNRVGSSDYKAGLQRCRQIEQRSYDYTRLIWDQMDLSDQEYCSVLAAQSPAMQYDRLARCSAEALHRTRLRDQKPFRY